MIGLGRRLTPVGRGWMILLALIATFAAPAARAVPSFAAQTGQPCNACHVGGLGPQLTPFGRDFKLRGYTARAVPWNIPLAGFVNASYVATAKAQDAPPPRRTSAVTKISRWTRSACSSPEA